MGKKREDNSPFVFFWRGGVGVRALLLLYSGLSLQKIDVWCHCSEVQTVQLHCNLCPHPLALQDTTYFGRQYSEGKHFNGKSGYQ